MSRSIWRSAGYLLPLGVWLVAARSLDLAVALPPPGVVFLRTVALFGSEGFLAAAAATVIRTITALAIAGVTAIPLGIAAARYETVRLIVAPSVVVVRSIPFISIILVAVIWFTSGTVPPFVALMMIVPLLYESTYTGVRGIDPKLEEMTRSFAFSRRARLQHLWIPGATPTILGGFRSANGIAWKVTVAAEVISVPRRGIGTAMGEARLYLETETVLAWTIVLIVFAGLSDRGIGAVERLLRRRRGARRYGAAGNDRYHPTDSIETDRRLPRSAGLSWAERSGPAAPAIEIRHLTFSWRTGGKKRTKAGGADGAIRDPGTGDDSIPILRHFDVDLASGEVTALIGPSGVGKTTILRILGGVLESDEGTITTPGISGYRTATVFQEPRLLPWRTVAENVALSRVGTAGGRAFPGADRYARREVAEALRTVDLDGQEDRYPDELSGGMQQRVGLARALYAHPDLLLIDEPLSGVDQAHRDELSEYLRSTILAARVTTVISSHDLPFVYTVADRILLLEERPARIVLDVHRGDDGWAMETVREIEERLRRSRHTL
ncbi:MAG: ATP-binding cassette domain-containing protein [Alkalispirochaeta sp.]